MRADAATDPPVQPPQFRLTLLPSSGPGEATFAAAVNESGHVAGVVQHATEAVVHSAFWPDPALAPILSSGDGADFSNPLDINAAGVVVGQAHEGLYAYTWVPGTDIVQLPTLGPCCPSANAVSDSGVVVGFSVFGNGGQRPTRWSGGAPQDLGVVAGDTGGLCNDINEAGHIVGQSGMEAAHWNGGPAVRLPFPGSVLFSIAHEINALDEIVGEVSTGGPSRAVVWRNGEPTELPSLGGTWSAALAINAASWIVGLAQGVPGPSDVNVRAALWIDGQPFDLNALTIDLPPGVRLLTACDVNDGGVIVGEAYSLTDVLTRGFVLTPVAPTWTDLGHGLAGSAGVPALTGSGTLEPASPMALTLAGAAPTAASALVLGFSLLQAPFKGGVLVPMPNHVFTGLLTSGSGGVHLAAAWPSGVPSGFAFLAQFWVKDAAGPTGFSASNGVRGTAP